MAGTLTFREAVSRFVNVFAEVMNAIAKKKQLRRAQNMLLNQAEHFSKRRYEFFCLFN